LEQWSETVKPVFIWDRVASSMELIAAAHAALQHVDRDRGYARMSSQIGEKSDRSLPPGHDLLTGHDLRGGM
jgi:hypothetical protein